MRLFINLLQTLLLAGAVCAVMTSSDGASQVDQDTNRAGGVTDMATDPMGSATTTTASALRLLFIHHSNIRRIISFPISFGAIPVLKVTNFTSGIA